MRLLEIRNTHMIFEISVDGLDIEVRVNCQDGNHEKGAGYDTYVLKCPTMVMSETNALRFERDFKVLGIKAIRLYEEKYSEVKQQAEIDGDLDW